MKPLHTLATGFFLSLWALVMMPSSSLHGQTSLTNGLVGYYPFSGDANDLSGQGNNAVTYGVELGTDRFGVAFESYSFTNRNAYIATTNSVGFPFSTNDFTVCLWLRLDSLLYPATDGVLWLFANKKLGQFELSLHPNSTSSGYLSFMTGLNGSLGGSTTPTAAVQWVTNQWYHLVVRRNNNVITIYRDSMVLGQGSAVDGFRVYGNDAALPLIFGNRYVNIVPSNSRPLSLDDIRVYNRALSTMELQELQEYGSGLRLVAVKALKPSFYNLSVGTSYQLQVADGLGNWTNHGAPFTATNSLMIYPQYWDVPDWPQLFFRLQVIR